MKTARKVLIIALCAVLLVSASVMGTLAYLADQTKVVTNTFSVGNVSFDAESALDEAKVDEYGVEVSPEERVTANTYKLIPGHTYAKDPTVHMADSSEDCYLFVEVVNGISAIEATGDTTIAKQMEKLGWVNVNGNIYIYTENGAKAPVAGGADKVVFNSFTLADNAEVKDYAKASITIKAYAIQVDGLEDKDNTELWTILSGELA